MNMNDKKLLLITGAGASYDVIEDGKGESEYRPPLTRDLFKTITGHQKKCLSEHSLAAQVGHEYGLQAKNKVDMKGLEDYLKKLKDSPTYEIWSKFYTIPLYLRALFLPMVNKYLPIEGFPNNYKYLVDKIIESKYEEVIWLNLNYDLFADTALKKTFSNFHNFNDYMNLQTKDKKTKIMYTKPHGCVNWCKALVDVDTSDDLIKNGDMPLDFGEKLKSSEVHFWNKTSNGMKINGKPVYRYPAISAPIGDYEFVYQSHIDTIKPILKETSCLLCIGFSALDQDILDLINIMPEILKLKIVNGKNNPSGKETYWTIFKEKKITVGIEDSVYQGGFTDFLGSGIDGWLGL